MRTEYRMPLLKAALIVLGLGAASAICIWSWVSDRPIELVGLTMPPWFGLALAAAFVLIGLYFAFMAVSRRPYLTIDANGLLWRRFPFPKQIAWSDVDAIFRPVKHSIGFGNAFFTIDFYGPAGRTLRLWVDPHLAEEVFDESVRRWRDAAGS